MASEFKDISQTFTKPLSPENFDSSALEYAFREPLEDFLRSRVLAKRLSQIEGAHTTVAKSPTPEELHWIQHALIENAPHVLREIAVRQAICRHELYVHATTHNLSGMLKVDNQQITLGESATIMKELRSKAFSLIPPDFQSLRQHFHQICASENTWTYESFDIHIPELKFFVTRVYEDACAGKSIPQDLLQWLKDFSLIQGPFLFEQGDTQAAILLARMDSMDQKNPEYSAIQGLYREWQLFSKDVFFVLQYIQKIFVTLQAGEREAS